MQSATKFTSTEVKANVQVDLAPEDQFTLAVHNGSRRFTATRITATSQGEVGRILEGRFGYEPLALHGYNLLKSGARGADAKVAWYDVSGALRLTEDEEQVRMANAALEFARDAARSAVLAEMGRAVDLVQAVRFPA